MCLCVYVYIYIYVYNELTFKKFSVVVDENGSLSPKLVLSKGWNRKYTIVHDHMIVGEATHLLPLKAPWNQRVWNGNIGQK